MVSLSLLACSKAEYAVITVLNTSQDIYDCTVEVENGHDSIEPLAFLNSSYEPGGISGDSVSATFRDYAGMLGYDMVENIAEIPAITESKEMNLVTDDTIEFLGVEIYDANQTLIDSWDSWIIHPELAQGQYFVVLSIHNEIGSYYLNAQLLFVLNVD